MNLEDKDKIEYNCQICKKYSCINKRSPNPKQPRHNLGIHLRRIHQTNLKDYSIEYEHDGKIPTCKCGCGKEVTFYMGYWRNFVMGHAWHESWNINNWTEEHRNNFLIESNKNRSYEENVVRGIKSAQTKLEKYGTLARTEEEKEKISVGLAKAYEDGTRNLINIFSYIKWYDYKDFKVHGTYELRTCYILDKMKELILIKDWEYLL